MLQAVCFDVDSTFCTDESIDEIASFLGVGEKVAEMTARAMGGSMKFQDALKMRLDVMNVSAEDMDHFLAEHPFSLSPGMTSQRFFCVACYRYRSSAPSWLPASWYSFYFPQADCNMVHGHTAHTCWTGCHVNQLERWCAGIPELVRKLQARGTAVALVSGGFRQIIEPIAESLSIPLSHVHANRLLFKPDGSADGFDATEFTSRSGGKAEACKFLKQQFGYERVVMVGDGATDLEARQPGGAEIFICYGGVVLRESVAEQSDWVVTTIGTMTDAL